jgi:hypothetical protein
VLSVEYFLPPAILPQAGDGRSCTHLFPPATQAFACDFSKSMVNSGGPLPTRSPIRGHAPAVAPATSLHIECHVGECDGGFSTSGPSRPDPTEGSVRTSRFSCTTPVAHPARHWRKRPETPASGDPRFGSGAANHALTFKPDHLLGLFNGAARKSL